MKLPPIKKTINSFLLNETGKISKNSLLKLGFYSTSVLGLISTSKASCNGAGGHGSATIIGEGTEHSSAHCSTACPHQNCGFSAHANMSIECEDDGDYLLMPTEDTHSNVDSHANTSGNCGHHDNVSISGGDTAQCYGHKNEISLVDQKTEIFATHSHDIKDLSVDTSIAGTSGDRHMNSCTTSGGDPHLNAECHANRATTHSNTAHSNHNNAGGGGSSPSN